MFVMTATNREFRPEDPVTREIEAKVRGLLDRAFGRRVTPLDGRDEVISELLELIENTTRRRYLDALEIAQGICREYADDADDPNKALVAEECADRINNYADTYSPTGW